MDENGEAMNPRGAGILFGPDVTNMVCERLNVNMIIRSHQPHLSEVMKKGYAYHHDDKVLTISSTTVYGGKAVWVEIERDKILIHEVE